MFDGGRLENVQVQVKCKLFPSVKANVFVKC